jgi:hypothetical protein
MFWTLDSLNYSRRDDMNDAPAIRCSASCLPEKASLHRCFAILTPAGTRGERHE